MRLLLPAVHNLLIVHATLVEQDVNGAEVIDVAMALKLGADRGSDLGFR